MLNYFKERKETSSTIKNRIFQRSKKSHFFPNGLIQVLDRKMPNSSLIRFGHNKTKNKA